jgi:hypothetical protein
VEEGRVDVVEDEGGFEVGVEGGFALQAADVEPQGVAVDAARLGGGSWI